MLLRWMPPDGEEHEYQYQFAPAKLRTTVAERIESVGGEVWDNYDEFGRLFQKRNRRALRAALWACRLETEPGLTFESLDLGVYEVLVDLGDDEKAVMRSLLAAGAVENAEQRAAFVELLGEDPEATGPKDDSTSASPPEKTP